MAIAVTCQACGRQYNVKDEAAGKKFKCKDCGEVVSVPEGGGGGGGAADDFGDPYNPYAEDEFGEEGAAAPVAARRPKKKRGRGASLAAERLKLPAIFLLIITALSVVNHVAGLVMHFMGVEMFPMGPAQNPAEEFGRMIGGVIGGTFGIVMDTLAIVGAISMLRVSSFGLAMTGAIVSSIPCASPCCFLGIPFGIWALVVLNDADVRAAFR
jgi:hypothetical protein